jgi:hypothetical protein
MIGQSCFKSQGTSLFTNFCLARRHARTAIYLNTQSLKQVPRRLRQSTILWVLFKYAASNVLSTDFYPEISNLLTEENFRSLYEHAVKGRQGTPRQTRERIPSQDYDTRTSRHARILPQELLDILPHGLHQGFSKTFDFTSTNRSNELLGFPQALTVCTTTSLLAPRPFNLCRTPLLVMHTDIQPAYPQCKIDNLGITQKPFDNSDIMAVIPVNQANRGLINYQATDKINRIWIKPEELRTLRIFITDDREFNLDLGGCEWRAVFRVVYGDNLSI